MEACKSSLVVIAATLIFSTYATTVNPSINMPNDILGYTPTWQDQMNPLPYQNRADLQCFDPDNLAAMQMLPMFQKARQYIQLQKYSVCFFMLFCMSQSQDYYMFIYATNTGIIRLNIYSSRWHSKVTQNIMLDSTIYLKPDFIFRK